MDNVPKLTKAQAVIIGAYHEHVTADAVDRIGLGEPDTAHEQEASDD